MLWNRIVLLLVTAIGLSESAKCVTVCRVKDPSITQNSNVLSSCRYVVYPVQFTQDVINSENAMLSRKRFDGNNKLFSLYGDASSCSHFEELISTRGRRWLLIESIGNQLHESGFQGIDLRCEPANTKESQQNYADFLQKLRGHLGDKYTISVSIHSTNLEPYSVNTINEVVDLVHIPLPDTQLHSIQSFISLGLNRRKLVLDVSLPVSVNCPLDNQLTVIQAAANLIDYKKLNGAAIQLDRDDVSGVCGTGVFPLLSTLCTAQSSSRVGCTKGSSDDCSADDHVRDIRNAGNIAVEHPIQCPQGNLSNLCNSTFQPIIQVACNDTACTWVGAIDKCNCIPFPNFGGNNGGINSSTNRTSAEGNLARNVTSALLALLNNLNVEIIIADLNGVMHSLKNVINKLLPLLELSNEDSQSISQLNGLQRTLAKILNIETINNGVLNDKLDLGLLSSPNRFLSNGSDAGLLSGGNGSLLAGIDAVI
ncbi:uncharacterized protein LOC131438850 [Malaya genurostris]|uniref:uncharacterized protein LOC131438850 n=1 Tax=Malaya genurostris TaxID=325434 RepID=UPI0026F3CB1E|nr:uncharacterized protein LOC131438850 [Malaya genurostris]